MRVRMDERRDTHSLDEIGGPNPVLVEMARGGFVESFHRGIVVETSAEGELRFALGDHQRLIYPRSLIKPLHAIPLITSGAAARFGLGREEVALAASSHLARVEQLVLLKRWINRVGLREDQLECGTHRPFDGAVADALVVAGERPSEIHNNNSGRHLAILTIAKHCGYPLANYREFQHPVQSLIREAVHKFLNWNYSAESCVTDECGLPTQAISISLLCEGLARMCEQPGTCADGIASGRMVLNSMAALPELVTGSGKISTMLCQATDGQVIVKGGSEGGFAAIVPGAAVALVLKIDDGAHRAAEVVLLEILWRRGLINKSAYLCVKAKFDGALRNYRRDPTSELRFAF
jgi:L-asparaginase II